MSITYELNVDADRIETLSEQHPELEALLKEKSMKNKVLFFGALLSEGEKMSKPELFRKVLGEDRKITAFEKYSDTVLRPLVENEFITETEESWSKAEGSTRKYYEINYSFDNPFFQSFLTLFDIPRTMDNLFWLHQFYEEIPGCLWKDVFRPEKDAFGGWNRDKALKMLIRLYVIPYALVKQCAVSRKIGELIDVENEVQFYKALGIDSDESELLMESELRAVYGYGDQFSEYAEAIGNVDIDEDAEHYCKGTGQKIADSELEARANKIDFLENLREIKEKIDDKPVTVFVEDKVYCEY